MHNPAFRSAIESHQNAPKNLVSLSPSPANLFNLNASTVQVAPFNVPQRVSHGLEQASTVTPMINSRFSRGGDCAHFHSGTQCGQDWAETDSVDDWVCFDSCSEKRPSRMLLSGIPEGDSKVPSPSRMLLSSIPDGHLKVTSPSQLLLSCIAQDNSKVTSPLPLGLSGVADGGGDTLSLCPSDSSMNDADSDSSWNECDADDDSLLSCASNQECTHSTLHRKIPSLLPPRTKLSNRSTNFSTMSTQSSASTGTDLLTGSRANQRKMNNFELNISSADIFELVSFTARGDDVDSNGSVSPTSAPRVIKIYASASPCDRTSKFIFQSSISSLSLLRCLT